MSRPTEGGTVAWLVARGVWRVEPGLERTEELLGRLGRPHLSATGALVAGTNGKGSTCALGVAALVAAGHRVGSMPSPHLQSYRERVRIDGSPIDGCALDELMAEVRTHVERMDAEGRGPTQFEILTAAAALHFSREQVDFVVCEVGMGGRLDATNVLDLGTKVVTTIGLDHTAYLGSTLSEIAWNKAGIIRPGDGVVLGRLPAPARDTVRRVAGSAPARQVLELDRDFGFVAAGDDVEVALAAAEPRSLRLRPSLSGPHQRDNLAVAAQMVDVVCARAGIPPVDNDAWSRALTTLTKVPGRLETVERGQSAAIPDRWFLLDGAHNAQALGSVAPEFEQRLGSDAVVVFGAMEDKNPADLLAQLPTTWRLILVAPDSSRAMPASRLAELAQSLGFANVRACREVSEALRLAASLADEGVGVLGSLYLVGDARTALGLPPA